MFYYSLGSYGINHGVELHADVVEYALEKLDEFMHTSHALDEYEFCKPKFVVGGLISLRLCKNLAKVGLPWYGFIF